jgi:hypothetical protein
VLESPVRICGAVPLGATDLSLIPDAVGAGARLAESLPVVDGVVAARLESLPLPSARGVDRSPDDVVPDEALRGTEAEATDAAAMDDAPLGLLSRGGDGCGAATTAALVPIGAAIAIAGMDDPEIGAAPGCWMLAVAVRRVGVPAGCDEAVALAGSAGLLVPSLAIVSAS